MGTSYVRFAQAYGDDAYSDCTYNNTKSCTTSGGGSTDGGNSGSGAGGSLDNTGLMIALILTIACVTIFVALLVRFWRRPKKLVTEVVPEEPDEATADDSDQHQQF